MNEHEVRGGARYVGGKIEKAVGDAVESRDWQVDGVVDQVSGAAENIYGRAQSVAEDAIDAAPGLIDEAKEIIGRTSDQAKQQVRGGLSDLRQAADGRSSLLLGLGGAALGYALGWLVHGRTA